MPKRIPHTVYSTIFSTVYLVMGVNALLGITCIPFLIVLVTTDPSLSWPLLAVTAALCAPGLAGAFAVFREHSRGENRVLKPFLDGVRATCRRALVIGVLVASTVVVCVADVFVLAPTRFGMAVAPLLGVIAVLALATGAVSLVAMSEAPGARVWEVVRISAALGVRRWYLSLASLVVIGVQAGIVVAAPALGIGITSAACLYVVWAGSRHTLQPALGPAAASVAA